MNKPTPKYSSLPEINIINPSDIIEVRFPKPDFLVSGLIMLVTGALLPLAFAPFSYALVAVLSFVLFNYVLSINPKKTFLLGLFFGLGYFGVGVSWVSVSMHKFGNMPLPLAYFATFLFVLVLALFPAASAWLANKIKSKFKVKSITMALLVVPTAWILFEALRSWVLTGFPWLIVGVSQVESPLGAVLPLVGETGTSWLTLVFAGAAFLALTGKIKERLIAMALLAFIWLSLGYINQVEWTEQTGEQTTVALVQGNTKLEDKWDPSKQAEIFATYLENTQSRPQVDLVVWPETAIPSVYPEVAQQILPKLYQTLGKTTLMSGIIYQTESGSYHNSLLQLSDKKETFYHKRHLVPFGEYTPLADNIVGWVMGSLAIPMSNLVPGKNAENTLILDKNTRIAPSICYEVAYSHLIRQDSAKANILLTISNDTWFGRSLAPAQHLQIAQARAKENGKPMIRATNTGLTATINAYGEIQKQIPDYQIGVLVDTIATYQGSTPYVRYGLWPFLALLALLLGFGLRRKKL